MTTNAFGYNGLDTRVSKTDSTGSRTYRRDCAYVTDPVVSDTIGGATLIGLAFLFRKALGAVRIGKRA